MEGDKVTIHMIDDHSMTRNPGIKTSLLAILAKKIFIWSGRIVSYHIGIHLGIALDDIRSVMLINH